MKKSELKSRIEELEYQNVDLNIALDHIVKYIDALKGESAERERITTLELSVMRPCDNPMDEVRYGLYRENRAAARACVTALDRALEYTKAVRANL